MVYRKERAESRRAAFERVEAKLGLADTMKLPAAYTNTGREEQYLHGLEFGKALIEDTIEHRHDVFNDHTHQYALVVSSPFGHNPSMFTTALSLQTSPEQRARWIPLVEAGKIVGTYVQTEIGHGTFVRGLETTATFDQATDEFIINSPTLTSTKYWPTALAFTASHAIVMARLILKKKDLGVHPFLVQLRSLVDYKNLPGVETGDIGSKMGYNTADMGYAIFNHVRIPRDQMLMGHAKLSRDGQYTRPPHDKLSYITMMNSRLAIIRVSSFQLAQAAVIATRFSVVREQGVGVSTNAKQEWAIINYKSQQYRLLGIMAQAYALFFAGQACTKTNAAVRDQMQLHDDHSRLPDNHALSSALKAYCSELCANGVEDARKTCGGFGFSDMSGFHAITSTASPLPTLEGENYVMYQQIARYILKGVRAVQDDQPVAEALRYLNLARPAQCGFTTAADLLNVNNQLAMFRRRAARLAFQASSLLENSQKAGKLSYADAWNKHMLPLVRAGRAHIELYVLESFTSAVDSCLDPAARQALTHLRNLFALTAIENPLLSGAMQFVEDGYVNVEQLAIVRDIVDDLLAALLPEIIALGDAWNFTDASLGSAIGMYDGNVYERIMAWTKQLPLNVQARKDESMHRRGYEGFIEPLLKVKL